MGTHRDQQGVSSGSAEVARSRHENRGRRESRGSSWALGRPEAGSDHLHPEEDEGGQVQQWNPTGNDRPERRIVASEGPSETSSTVCTPLL